MPRQKGTTIENNFIGGYNTEATALSFPSNACTETKNCVFNETGRVTRRKEIDIEEGGTYSSAVTSTSAYAYSEYLWHNAGGTGLINLLCVQDGATLRFYNVSSSASVVSTNQLAGTVSLTTYKVLNTPHSVEGNYCQFTVGNGTLLVVHKACDPILVKFNPNTSAITSSAVTIKYRDFIGLSTGYAQSLRPGFASIAAMKGDATGALHFYNLLNQGWHNGVITSGSPDATSALGQWDAARADMPSSQDYIGYYRASETDPFDPARVDNNSQGNTPAPKGHFILNLGNADRRQALIDDGYTLTFTSVTEEAIDQTTGTSIAGAGSNGGVTSSSNVPITKTTGASIQLNATNTVTNDTVSALNVEAPFDDNFNNALYRTITHTTSASTGTKEMAIVSGKNYTGAPKNISQVVINPHQNSVTSTFNNSYGHSYVNAQTGADVEQLNTGGSNISQTGSGMTSQNGSSVVALNTAYLTDGNTSTSVYRVVQYTTTGSKSTAMFYGRNFSSGSEKVSKVVLKPNHQNSFGVVQNISTTAFITSTITFQLRASNTAPVIGTEGTLLGSQSFSCTSANWNTQTNRTITSNDTTTSYQYVWIYTTVAYTQANTQQHNNFLNIGEFEVYTMEPSSVVPAFYENTDYIFELRGHTSAPVSGTEGTLLGSSNFTTNVPGSHSVITITSSDTTTTWNYVWVYFKHATTKASGTVMDTYAKLGEIQFYTVNTTTTGAGLSSGAAGDLFDGNQTTGIVRTNTYTTISTKVMDIYGGKNYSSSAKRISKVVVRPFNITSTSYGGSVQNSLDKDISLTFELRGHSSAPTNGTEGTLLGSYSFSSSSSTGHSDITISSSDTSTSWNYVWVYAKITTIQDSTNSLQLTMQMSELQFYTAVTVSGSGSLPGADVTVERPTACVFYAGRAWYAGIDSSELGTTLYFSQIIENDTQYGKCYQENDPTSESFSALLDSDGGTIRIPEIGKIIKMHAQQTALIVFATNGIWVIQGSERNTYFNATNFSVKRISSLGTQSPRSFIDIQGLPSWWGEDGIFMMEYNPQFDSFEVKSLTLEKIQRHFLNIDPLSRSLVKGAYDTRNDLAYWIYTRDTTNLPNNNFDTVLVYNKRSKAFYEWDISISTPRVVGLSFVYDSVGFSDPRIKFTTIVPLTSTTKRIFFSDCYDTTPTYIDWKRFSTGTYGIAGDAKPFTSYFITGYRIDGETQKFLQSNYVMMFLETEANSAAYMQGIYDFTNSGDSGKWSSRQDVYNSSLLHRDINYRRLKVRGKGRALQLKVSSKEGAPFNIIGWSILETINSDV